jgi:3-hydroxyacyl-CoA dehydrogenase
MHPQEVKGVAIIGSGVRGHSIAQVFAHLRGVRSLDFTGLNLVDDVLKNLGISIPLIPLLPPFWV